MAEMKDQSVTSKLSDPTQKNTITLAAISLLIVLVMVVVAIRPAVVSVARQHSANKERRTLIERQESKIRNLKVLTDQKNTYNNEINLFNDFYNSIDDAELIVRNIYEYQNDHDDIAIQKVGFDFKTIEKGEINMSIMYYCDVDEAVGFLEYIDSFPKILNVVSVTYSPDEGEKNFTGLPIVGTLELKLYIKVDQPETNI